MFENCNRCGVRNFNPLPPHGGRPKVLCRYCKYSDISIHSLRMEGDQTHRQGVPAGQSFQSTPSAWRETEITSARLHLVAHFNPLPPHGGRPNPQIVFSASVIFQSTPSAWRETIAFYFGTQTEKFQSTPSAWRETEVERDPYFELIISIHSLRMEGDVSDRADETGACRISIHSLRMEGDSKTAQESVFHFAYPCTILQKRMQKTTFCTRKNGFFRKKGEKFGAKPSASFCAPMIRTDTFPLNFSHRISGSSMSMVSFAPICSTFD